MGFDSHEGSAKQWAGGAFNGLIRRKQVDSVHPRSSSSSTHHQLAKELTVPHLVAIDGSRKIPPKLRKAAEEERRRNAAVARRAAAAETAAPPSTAEQTPAAPTLRIRAPSIKETLPSGSAGVSATPGTPGTAPNPSNTALALSIRCRKMKEAEVIDMDTGEKPLPHKCGVILGTMTQYIILLNGGQKLKPVYAERHSRPASKEHPLPQKRAWVKKTFVTLSSPFVTQEPG